MAQASIAHSLLHSNNARTERAFVRGKERVRERERERGGGRERKRERERECDETSSRATSILCELATRMVKRVHSLWARVKRSPTFVPVERNYKPSFKSQNEIRKNRQLEESWLDTDGYTIVCTTQENVGTRRSHAHIYVQGARRNVPRGSLLIKKITK